MNCVLIFAGGTGQRMNTRSRPKQFMELHGKPIIVQTIEAFEFHPDIDAIVVACLEEWIPFLQRQLRRYDIEKVVDVVPGGPTGQASIRNGVEGLAARFPGDAVVLVHDGVRPLVDRDTISACTLNTRRRCSIAFSSFSMQSVSTRVSLLSSITYGVRVICSPAFTA